MMNLSSMRWTAGCILVALVSGCSMGKSEGWKFTQTWDVRRVMGLKKDEPATPEIPTRLVSTWEDAVLNRVGKKSERGFGGRLLFFNNASEAPIRVDGQLVVYAYDEQGRASHETHPTRRFVFPAEQFGRHESECKLGPSYSVWIPWDEVGGAQKNISLIARFEPKGGPLIVGDQTRHLLPGMRQLADGKMAPAVEPISDIRLTQYSQTSELKAPAPANERDKSSKVTSIALSNKSWAKRLAAAQKSSAPESTQRTSEKQASTTDQAQP